MVLGGMASSVRIVVRCCAVCALVLGWMAFGMVHGMSRCAGLLQRTFGSVRVFGCVWSRCQVTVLLLEATQGKSHECMSIPLQ